MSKFDERLATYKASLDEYGGGDHELLTKVTKGLGPSIYNNDANKVACSQASELERVVTNFCVKKLGVSVADAEAAIARVCKKYDTRSKHRAVFYYMVTKDLGRESVYG